MTKREVISPQTPAIEASGLRELRESLDNPAINSGEMHDIVVAANDLIANSGIHTLVNGRPAVVSAHYAEVSLGTEDKRYAYLSQVGTPEVKSLETMAPISVIFASQPGTTDMRVPSTTTMLVQDGGIDGSVTLWNGDQQVKSKECDELARQIITAISEKTYKDTLAKREKDITETRFKVESKRRKRIKVAKGIGKSAFAVGVAGIIFYPHLVFGFGDIDASIGPIPMPWPIEAIVDANNHSDHAAQGFGEPSGALPLRIGIHDKPVPLVTSYDTDGVPDATYVENVDKEGTTTQFDFSKPGLYESSFITANTVANEKTTQPVFDDQGCYTITGDYHDGKTLVFTQTPDFNDNMTIKVADADTLDVCAKPGTPKGYQGSIFIYQKPVQ